MTGMLILKNWRQICTQGEHLGDMKAEVRKLPPQAKGCQIPPQTTRNQEKGSNIFSSQPSQHEPAHGKPDVSLLASRTEEANFCFFLKVPSGG